MCMIVCVDVVAPKSHAWLHLLHQKNALPSRFEETTGVSTVPPFCSVTLQAIVNRGIFNVNQLTVLPSISGHP